MKLINFHSSQIRIQVVTFQNGTKEKEEEEKENEKEEIANKQ